MGRPSARERLLDAAEALFADHGVAGVSLRTINSTAGLSPAALHYHFGTQSGAKHALVEALLERRMEPLMARRSELMDAVEATAGPPRAIDVMDALLRPMVELIEREGDAGRRYLRLLCRLQADRDIDGGRIVSRYRSGIGRLEPLLQRALPQHSIGEVRLRLGLALDLTLRSLADADGLGSQWRGEAVPLPLPQLVQSILSFVVGGLEAEDASGRAEASPNEPLLDGRGESA